MSSDFDDYSSLDEREQQQRQQQQQLYRAKVTTMTKCVNGNLNGNSTGEVTSSCVDDSDSPSLSHNNNNNLGSNTGSLSAYVNMHSSSSGNKGGSSSNNNNSQDSRREKARYSHGRHTRKSRSRERPRATPIGGGSNEHQTNSNLYNNAIGPNSALNFVGGPIDTERIHEREKELEKIHRRSRELMLSPRTIMEAGSNRDSSLDRRSSKQSSSTSGVALDGWKPAPPPPPTTSPPPLPPRVQSPGNSNLGYNSRYKSPSSGYSHQSPPPPPPPHHHARLPPTLPPHGPTTSNGNGGSGVSRRHHHHYRDQVPTRRIQSPHRREFQDFPSTVPPRDIRSPFRHPEHNRHHHYGGSRGSYFDDDDDSGADSLSNNDSANNCFHRHPHQRSRRHLHNSFSPPRPPSGGSSSMALVPYDSSASSTCYQHDHWVTTTSNNCCCRASYPMPQPVPGVEERLLQLEGDKDTLHLQVALLSDQIDHQTEKISDLEKILDDKKDVLRKTEDVLQREMLARSSLETKKLELMSEISGLKLRQAEIERENVELKKKLHGLVQGSGLGDNGPVLSLPPSGTSPASRNVYNTFGTMPRSSRSRIQQQKQQQLSSSRKNSNGLIETHFDISEDQINNSNDTNRYSYGTDDSVAPRLTNAHSGSAPSLVPETNEAVKATTVPRTARHQSVERVLVIGRNLSKAVQQPIATKPKGLKKILGRMRRSNSGTIHEERKRDASVGPCESIGRHNKDDQGSGSGGSRSSAGSRFAAWIGPIGQGMNNTTPYPDPSLPFRQWKVETICSWLDNLGLYMYTPEVRKHVKIGEQLLAMSSHDLESKLGMRSALHRKKVLLALQAKHEAATAMANGQSLSKLDLPGRLDHQWVVRWLDDVGLPQYKDAFLEARIDGRVLNLLTVEDLFHLKVTNLLHHLSIRRGIEVLRQNEFEPACLKRRASPDERDRSSLPIEVSLWTNHRVMEWLRHVDLAEYAPNLRGSGVHGALIVNEPRFTADLLAALLSIPANKTLLRRHLNLHFRDLVGPEIMREKRSAEEEPNYQALTPTTKVKPQKGHATSQFPMLKRRLRHDEMDFEDMVCPLEQEGN